MCSRCGCAALTVTVTLSLGPHTGLGVCSGWVPSKKPEGGIYGYATDDIFYLETCLYSQVSAIGLGLRRRHYISPNTFP